MKEQSGRPSRTVGSLELCHRYAYAGAPQPQNLKRPLESTLLENTLLTSPCMPHYDNETVEMNKLGNNNGSRLWISQQEESAAKRALLQQMNTTVPKVNRKGHLAGSGSVSIIPENDQHELDHHSFKFDNPLSPPDLSKLESEVLSDQMFDFPFMEGCSIDKMALNPVNPQGQNRSPSMVGVPQSDSANVNGLIPLQDTVEWMVHSSCQQGLQEHHVARSEAVLRNLSVESNNPSEIWNNTNVEPSDSSAILDEFCTLEDKDFQELSDCIATNFGMSQDVQSQITSESLAEQPHAFSMQDLAAKAGGASSSKVDFDECSFLHNNSRPQVAAKPPPRRTYTKVQRAGSVGRSIDVTAFKNYEELIHAIESMFGLEGLLNDTRGRDSKWKLVYVDYENDVLLVGDDPWGEFVGCVRCIRILSPTEVQKMKMD